MRKIIAVLLTLLLCAALLSGCAGDTVADTPESGQTAASGEPAHEFEDPSKLPEDYSGETAAMDGCAVPDETGAGLLPVAEFIANARKGQPDMMRLVRGDGSVTDVSFDGKLYTLSESDGESRTFGFLYADDENVYLSQCASLATTGFFPEAESVTLLTAEDGDLTDIIAAAKSLTTAVLSAKGPIYLVCSADGTRSVGATQSGYIIKEAGDSLKYLVETPEGSFERGSDDSDEIASQLTKIEWLDGTRVILSFKTFYDICYFETLDTEKMEVERHSYSESYTVKDGEVTYVG